jgi:hypothetical protein
VETAVFGGYVLIVAGALLFLGGGYAAIWKPAGKAPWLLVVFGFAAAGVGTYGPSFLGPLGDFVKAIDVLGGEPTEKEVQGVLDDVGRGQFSGEQADAVVNQALSLDRDPEAMKKALDAAAAGATSPAGRKALKAGAEALEGKIRVSAALEKAAADPLVLQAIRAEIGPEAGSRITRTLTPKAAGVLRRP